MTDLAEAGSVAARPAGNLATPPASGDNGSAPAAGRSWFDGLSEGNRKLAEAKGWTKAESLDRVFTSYAELERPRRLGAAAGAADVGRSVGGGRISAGTCIEQ